MVKTEKQNGSAFKVNTKKKNLPPAKRLFESLLFWFAKWSKLLGSRR